MSLRRSPRAAVLGVTVGALAAGGLAVAVPASAASTTVVISEVYGAGGNAGASHDTDFIELRNLSSSAVDLTGMSVQYASATGSNWSNRTALTGSIPAGGTYLVTGASGANGAAVPTGDAAGSINLSGSNGKVALVQGTAALTCGATCAGTAGVLDFLGYGAVNDAEGGHPAPALTATTSATRTAGDSDDNAVDFTAAAPSPMPSAGGTDPDPDPDPEPDPDPDPTPDPLDCATAVQTIGAVQGSGPASPVAGQTVTVAGTVVGDVQAGYRGVFVQDAGDGAAATSDGVFVYAPNAPALDLGDRVVVRGTVTEYLAAATDTRTLTEITDATLVECAPTGPAPTATPLPLPSTDAQREALEGMLVAPAGELTVTEVYDLNRYGEILLATGGRLLSPTEAAEPGDPARAVAAANAARSITLDDGISATLTGAPPFLTLDDPVRVGDGAELQPVVLSDGFGTWRLQPADGSAEGTTFPARNPRPAAPPAVGGDLRVADFNVLNYFVTFGGQSRGAANAAELAQQQAKIVTALQTLDADVITLHEIENSAVTTPGDDYRAVETLIAALEAADGHDWEHVRAHEDTDVITNAIIYRTDRVTAVGDPRIPTPDELTAFANARTPIAQTFSVRGEVFSVIANHLKSKGSGSGANADTGDGQGASNPDRIAQADVLVDFAARVAAESGDADVLLTGDFNSYRYEDPIDVITDAGYTDMAPLLAPDQYSYVFDGGSGSLDHVFASPSMVEKLTGLGVWDINAVESFGYEYDGYEGLYAPYAYRASDHNPTVFGVDVAATAAISDERPFRGDRVTVTGTGFAPGERVTASLPSRNRGQLGTATADAEGRVSITFTVPATLPAGDQEVLLTGTSGNTASTGFELRPLLQELLARLIRWLHHG